MVQIKKILKLSAPTVITGLETLVLSNYVPQTADALDHFGPWIGNGLRGLYIGGSAAVAAIMTYFTAKKRMAANTATAGKKIMDPTVPASAISGADSGYLGCFAHVPGYIFGGLAGPAGSLAGGVLAQGGASLASNKGYTKEAATVTAAALVAMTPIAAAEAGHFQGPTGHDGSDGTSGADGANGPNGHDGTNGATGDNGTTPHIEGGYWWIGDKNTSIKAGGSDGTNGATPEIIGGYWWIDGKNTTIKAIGSDGKDGKDGTGPSANQILYNLYWAKANYSLKDCPAVLADIANNHSTPDAQNVSWLVDIVDHIDPIADKMWSDADQQAYVQNKYGITVKDSLYTMPNIDDVAKNSETFAGVAKEYRALTADVLLNRTNAERKSALDKLLQWNGSADSEIRNLVQAYEKPITESLTDKIVANDTYANTTWGKAIIYLQRTGGAASVNVFKLADGHTFIQGYKADGSLVENDGNNGAYISDAGFDEIKTL